MQLEGMTVGFSRPYAVIHIPTPTTTLTQPMAPPATASSSLRPVRSDCFLAMKHFRFLP
jgi:hypothetical protein